jgi:hypothetical protein
MFKKLYKACKKRHEATKGKCVEDKSGCNGVGYCEKVFEDIRGKDVGKD